MIEHLDIIPLASVLENVGGQDVEICLIDCLKSAVAELFQGKPGRSGISVHGAVYADQDGDVQIKPGELIERLFADDKSIVVFDLQAQVQETKFRLDAALSMLIGECLFDTSYIRVPGVMRDISYEIALFCNQLVDNFRPELLLVSDGSLHITDRSIAGEAAILFRRND